MSPPHTFTLFPELPKHLRCTLPGPRIIQLHYLNGTFISRGACPPPVLHACQTSREVALTVFECAFAQDKPICIAHDTLYLATSSEMCKHTVGLYPGIKEKIQSLAVGISSPEDLEKSVIDIGLSHLSNLREIIFVVGETIERLIAFKHPERVRFSEPEATASFLWQKGWVEGMDLFKGCVVRVVEAKIV